MSKGLHINQLGLDNGTTSPTEEGHVVMNNGEIEFHDGTGVVTLSADVATNTTNIGTNTTNITSNTDAINALSAGEKVLQSADSCTMGLGNITLSGEQTINGVATSNSRIVVLEQTDPAFNGVYITDAGAWTRATDFDAVGEITKGSSIMVLDPASGCYRDKFIVFSDDVTTVDTDPITFTIIKAIDFGTTAGTAAEGNDSRFHDAATLNAGTVTQDGADLTGQELTLNLATASNHGLLDKTDKSKLDNIDSGAEVNVNADWNAVSGDAEILNKPTDLTDLSTHNVTELLDVSDAGSGAIITTAERNALHDAVTLNAGTVTQDSASLSSQELTIKKQTATTHGVIDPNGIQLNPNTVKPAHSEGLVFWDSAEKAFVAYNDESEITQQLGREFYRRVRNESGATIVNGKAVYQSGGEAGGEFRPLIDLAQADAEGTSNVIGVATHDIENNSYGYVTVLGDVNDVDTSGLTAGNILYLSPTVAGGLTATKPTSPDQVVQVATVEKVDAVTGRYNVGIANLGGALNDVESAAIVNYRSTIDEPITTTPEYISFPTLEIQNSPGTLLQNAGDDTRFDVLKTGEYYVQMNMNHKAGGSVNVTTKLIKNGTTELAEFTGTTNPASGPGSYATPGGAIPLVAGDYLQVEAVTNTSTGDIGPSSISIHALQGLKGDTGPTGAGSNIIGQDEGVTQGTVIDTLNFVGDGVTLTEAAGVGTVTIPGGGGGGGGTYIQCTKDNGNPEGTSSTSYATIGRKWIYEGGAGFESPKVILYRDGTATSAEARIYDITNAQEICTVSTTSMSADNIETMGAVSGLPGTDAVFEVQVKRTGGSGNANIFGVLLR